MCYLRYIFLFCLCLSLTTSTVVFAEDDAVPEAAAEVPAADAIEEAVAPPAVSLIAGMTVDEMLKSVNAPARESYQGTIADVISGAMLIVARNGTAMKARLYGVDCPEPGQGYHQESRQYAVDKFLNENVNVCVLATDSQQNPVVLVFNSNGESLSHLMVVEGMAWWDRRNAQKDALLRRLNAEAITNSVGLYADPTSLAPWDYRDSRGLDQFTYTLDVAAAQEPPKRTLPAASKDEPKTLSAKGTMTQNATRAPVDISKDIGKDINIATLMGKHLPSIATDDANQPLGLTATDISQIPYAAQFGFRDNDIISSVNGIAVKSIPQILEMAPQFEGVKQFNVDVIRNGQHITIPININ